MQNKKLVGAAAVVISAAIGAAIALAATGGSTTTLSSAPAAATSQSTGVTSTLPVAATGNGTAADPGRPSGPHTVGNCTEALLTGADKTKAEDAAKAAVSNATIERTETDCDGSKYEVHMARSDGTNVTVKEDANFKVTSVDNGPGPGGPRPGGTTGTTAQPTTSGA